jgi:hypothetical protein
MTDSLITIAFMVGLVGDMLLQIYTNNVGDDMGLKNYFIQHGKVESLLIGAAIVCFAYILYMVVLQLPLSYTNLFIYGILVDFVFRFTRFFPSLNEYYDKLNIFQTAVIGGSGPAILPYFIYQMTLAK